MELSLAILYICTGKYNQFFEGFYKSSELFLLTNVRKHYYVWTDNDDLALGLDNVTVIHKECKGFPYDSLFRFEMFLQVEEKLKQYNYIYFFQANSEIQRPIGYEILPDETGLSMGIWPGPFEHRHPMFFPYERDKKSLAYVAPYGRDYFYYMGGINGGTAEAYLEMVRTLSRNIRDDYGRGIIAKVHDQSHINAYLRNHPCKRLGREFCLPEEWVKQGEYPKNIFRNKVKVDPYFNKGRKSDFWSRSKKKMKILWNALRWYLGF